jgi:hypothetical protein
MFVFIIREHWHTSPNLVMHSLLYNVEKFVSE